MSDLDQPMRDQFIQCRLDEPSTDAIGDQLVVGCNQETVFLAAVVQVLKLQEEQYSQRMNG